MIDPTHSGHYVGDCRELLARLPDECVQTCVTSPPYFGLRDYGADGQIGHEPTPDEYVRALVATFAEVRRVLRRDGTLWLNFGDSHHGTGSGPQSQARSNVSGAAVGGGARPGACNAPARGSRPRVAGLKPKDLIGIPWEVALALRRAGWWLRMDNIWAKPNPTPESVRDRPTKSHEYVFLLSKSERYFYDKDAVAEDSKWRGQNRSSRAPVASAMPGAPPQRGLRNDRPTGKRNLRSVWSITPKPYKGAHFATMPPELAQRCVLAGSRAGDVVLDPFFGSGTVGMVAEQLGRHWIGFDINPAYEALQRERIALGGRR